jgi:hypothetical protein
MMRRECLDPNEGFKRQLKEFEAQSMEFNIEEFQHNKDAECLIQRRHSLID